jgi:hypothetical protein
MGTIQYILAPYDITWQNYPVFVTTYVKMKTAWADRQRERTNYAPVLLMNTVHTLAVLLQNTSPSKRCTTGVT